MLRAIKFHRMVAGGIMVLPLFFLMAHAQQEKAAGGFPAPRYPNLKKEWSAEQLVEIARAVVKRPSNRDQLRPGYGIRKGEKVLIVVNSNFDRRVLNAISTAIAEAGGRPDIVITYAAPARSREGWTEIAPAVADNPVMEAGTGGRYEVPLKMATIGNYDLLIHGEGGPAPSTPFRWEYIPWNTMAKFVTGAPNFPLEVQELIDQKVWAAILKAKRIRVTDPEGTDISWSMKPEYFELLKSEWPGYGDDVVMKGHVSLTPLFMAPKGFDAQGVLAGTINHAGTYPAIKVFLEQGRITRIEGGGRNGELWRQFLNKYKDVQIPTFPGPGAGWLIEAAMATNPKVVRPPETQRGEAGMTWERLRSGVIHFGLGLTKPPEAASRPDFDEFAREHKIPESHFHVHTLFNTVEIETVDGKTIKVVDKGHLMVLDDPEVRQFAAKYGNPDEILREEWIPAVPGINVPGDYQRDYAAAPDAWILKEMQEYYDKK
ncbi:MAG: hypothetical protein HY645_13880 [Acidobacteria bacterium]|nr:hypothetical protein [Acidobacteriota bacterium]